MHILLLLLMLFGTAENCLCREIKRFKLQLPADRIGWMELSPNGNTIFIKYDTYWHASEGGDDIWAVDSSGHQNAQVGDTLFDAPGSINIFFIPTSDRFGYTCVNSSNPQNARKYLVVLDSIYGPYDSTVALEWLWFSEDGKDYCCRYTVGRGKGVGGRKIKGNDYLRTGRGVYGPLGEIMDFTFEQGTGRLIYLYKTDGRMCLAVEGEMLMSIDEKYGWGWKIGREREYNAITWTSLADDEYGMKDHDGNGFVLYQDWWMSVKEMPRGEFHQWAKEIRPGKPRISLYRYSRDSKQYLDYNDTTYGPYDDMTVQVRDTNVIVEYYIDEQHEGRRPFRHCYMMVNGRLHDEFAGFGHGGFSISPDYLTVGFVIHDTMRGDGSGAEYCAVVNGTRYGPYDSIYEPNEESISFSDGLQKPGLAFFEHGVGFAFVAKKDGKYLLYRNGSLVTDFQGDSVRGARLTADGKILSVYRHKGRWRLWIDGVVIKDIAGREYSHPSWTDDQTPWIGEEHGIVCSDYQKGGKVPKYGGKYGGWRNGPWFVYIKGKEYGPFMGRPSESVIDSTRWVIWCRDGTFVLNGKRYGPYHELTHVVTPDRRLVIAYIKDGYAIIEQVE